MNWPPMLIHIKIKNKDHHFGFWVPLFLIYPIVLAVLIILSPFILIAIFVIWLCGRGNWAMFTLKTALLAFCSLRGLESGYPGS